MGASKCPSEIPFSTRLDDKYPLLAHSSEARPTPLFRAPVAPLFSHQVPVSHFLAFFNSPSFYVSIISVNGTIIYFLM